MNKFYGEGKDGKVLVCVLEPGNIHKLTEERKPIEFSLNEGPYKSGLPAKMSIAIMYSETPVHDAEEFKKLLSTDSVFVDSRTPKLKTARPHCPECHSTIEQLGVWRSEESPIWLIFCVMCGCNLGATPPVPGLERSKK